VSGPTVGSVPVSVVMPAYNEEGGIEVAVAAVQEQVLDRVPGSELIAVNDGSRDQTGPLLDKLAAADPRVRVIHTPNGGHGPALMLALDAASGDYVFLIDSDNQIPIESFHTLWGLVHAKGPSRGDGAFGIRRVRHDAETRKVLSAFISKSLTLFFGVRIKDANIPFKLVRRKTWLDAQRFIPKGTLAPSLFLAVYMMRAKCDVSFVDVAHKERETGVASIRRWKLIKFCARAFRQLLEFRAAIGRI
jgi:dolichol-phosphate mannosyltransferase